MAEKGKPGGRVLSEIFGIILIAFAIFLCAALVTYHPADRSLFTKAAKVTVSNAMGPAGAHTSGVFFYAFGFTSYLMLAWLFYMAYTYIYPATARQRWTKYLGFLLFVVFMAALLDLVFESSLYRGKSISYGGLAGGSTAKILAEYLNRAGAYVVSIALVLVALTVVTGVSFISALRGAITLAQRISGRASEGWEFYKERRRRAKLLAEEQKKAVEEPPPVIVDTPTVKGEKPKPKPRQEKLFKDDGEGGFKLPKPSLLNDGIAKATKVDKALFEANSRLLEKKLKDYGIEGKVTEVSPGPVITLYEFEPAPGIKVSQIVNLSDDLALALRATSIRILAPIPGKGTVGIEIPNPLRETVAIKDLIVSEEFEKSKSFLTLALGKDIEGRPVVADLARMPHVLIAGATGSGKSVLINTMIMSILYKATPDQVQFLMVDPKMLELPNYDGIPNLKHPVVTDSKQAAVMLRWAVKQMEIRYKLLNRFGMKSLGQYNASEKEVKKRLQDEGSDEKFEKIPVLVIIIDELADLMIVSSKDVEESIARLAQKARAAGIHLVVATQRPSVDVITGTIKANFSARIALRVPSKTDSRTILDANGAEALLGLGDMLYMASGAVNLTRLHGAFLSEEEIHRVVEYLKAQGAPKYDTTIVIDDESEENVEDFDGLEDERYDEAVAMVADMKQASISIIQRRMRIGYNRAARLIERMEKEGVVRKGEGIKPYEVLIKPEGGIRE